MRPHPHFLKNEPTHSTAGLHHGAGSCLCRLHLVLFDREESSPPKAGPRRPYEHNRGDNTPSQDNDNDERTSNLPTPPAWWCIVPVYPTSSFRWILISLRRTTTSAHPNRPWAMKESASVPTRDVRQTYLGDLRAVIGRGVGERGWWRC